MPITIKRQKCIILMNKNRINFIEKEIIDSINSFCDIQYFYLPTIKKVTTPLFYKKRTVELNNLLQKYSTISSSNKLAIKTSGKDKTDFIFSLNADFDTAIAEKSPVIYIDIPKTTGALLALKEYIRNKSFIDIKIAFCYEQTSCLLSQSKLKIDRCFFNKNISFLQQVLPETCIQAIDLFSKHIPRIKNIPGLDYTQNNVSSLTSYFDLVLCYLLMPLRLFKKAVDFFCYWEQWHIGIVEDNIEKIISSNFNIDKVRWLPAVKKHQFIADPFGIKHNNKLHIFAELWDAQNPVGKIVRADESDSFNRWNTVFNHKTHLSYPFLFREGKKIYCLPESAESGDFTVYTAKIFPEEWNRGEILFRDFRMADASLLFWENKYWLFAAKANGDSAFELYIWFSNKINGKWEAHPMNPVKRDITSARPAGPPFIWENTIYRPAQDCSDSYGSRIIMNKVTLLSETEFKEEQAGIIKGPKKSPYPDGMHTFSLLDEVIVIDGKRKVFSLFNYRILLYKFKRIIKKF